MQKKTRQLLAFPRTGPNVRAKCGAMKAAVSISEEDAAHALAKHAILRVRTLFSYLEKIPALHGSTSS